MSMAVLQTPSLTSFNHFEKCSWPDPAEQVNKKVAYVEPEFDTNNDDQEQPVQHDTWNAIIVEAQAENKNSASNDVPLIPYVHPTMRRSSSVLSQKSLEVCTENLGSETGSDDFLSFCGGLMDYYSIEVGAEKQEVVDNTDDYQQGLSDYFEDEQQLVELNKHNELLNSVNYHCSTSLRSPVRSFPPPLPSISRRDGPCLQMRPHRRDGRLVVEAVAVPSQNYLHAERKGGRLLLSFIDATCDEKIFDYNGELIIPQQQKELVDGYTEEFDVQEEMEVHSFEDDEEEDEDEVEEVEVVDRGTVVEVKVRTQPGATKVHRSSLVINKFVGGQMPSSSAADCEEDREHGSTDMEYFSNNIAVSKRTAAMTTTAAAAVVAATTVSVLSTRPDYNGESCGSDETPELSGDAVQVDNKLLFTSRRRNRKELLHNMRRCSQLRRPLFIWEPYSVPTPSWA